jgi:cellulose synthase/poly-beta-1,6-N-acetylglucosamine synthase-like glycosyltransferase
MMIPILKDYYSKGYLPAGSETSIPAYVPNVNMAVRRAAIDHVGGYDEACAAGEDADLSVRTARAGWFLFFEPRARVYHEPRASVSALVRQWKWYGDGGSRFFAKQRTHRLEVYLNLDLPPQMHGYRRVIATRWWPVPTMLFVSYFTLAHAWLALAVGLAAVGWTGAAACAAGAMVLMLLAQWRRGRLRRLTGRELLLYAGMTYLVNWTCTIHSLRGGVRQRMLLLYPGL